MNFFDNAKVELVVKFPRTLDRIIYEVPISGLYADCLEKLPRNREVSWCPEERKQAEAMVKQRDELARELARRLTHVLLDIFSKRDPVNGYDPKP